MVAKRRLSASIPSKAQIAQSAAVKGVLSALAVLQTQSGQNTEASRAAGESSAQALETARRVESRLSTIEPQSASAHKAAIQADANAIKANEVAAAVRRTVSGLETTVGKISVDLTATTRLSRANDTKIVNIERSIREDNTARARENRDSLAKLEAVRADQQRISDALQQTDAQLRERMQLIRSQLIELIRAPHDPAAASSSAASGPAGGVDVGALTKNVDESVEKIATLQKELAQFKETLAKIQEKMDECSDLKDDGDSIPSASAIPELVSGLNKAMQMNKDECKAVIDATQKMSTVCETVNPLLIAIKNSAFFTSPLSAEPLAGLVECMKRFNDSCDGRSDAVNEKLDVYNDILGYFVNKVAEVQDSNLELSLKFDRLEKAVAGKGKLDPKDDHLLSILKKKNGEALDSEEFTPSSTLKERLISVVEMADHAYKAQLDQTKIEIRVSTECFWDSIYMKLCLIKKEKDKTTVSIMVDSIKQIFPSRLEFSQDCTAFPSKMEYEYTPVSLFFLVMCLCNDVKASSLTFDDIMATFLNFLHEKRMVSSIKREFKLLLSVHTDESLIDTFGEKSVEQMSARIPSRVIEKMTQICPSDDPNSFDFFCLLNMAICYEPGCIKLRKKLSRNDVLRLLASKADSTPSWFWVRKMFEVSLEVLAGVGSRIKMMMGKNRSEKNFKLMCLAIGRVWEANCLCSVGD